MAFRFAVSVPDQNQEAFRRVHTKLEYLNYKY